MAAQLLAPAPLPPSKLGVYRVLSSRAGVHVSPIQLGAMSIGDKWESYGFGSMDKETSFKLLDAYFDLGGNFIDTANNYQDQSSEEFIGEWAEKRGIRDQLVIATKVMFNHPRLFRFAHGFPQYTNSYQRDNDSIAQKINYVGNNTKSMHLSVDASLKKLRTTYIDILYVHWWDHETSVEEVMDSLHNLVVSGKVLYLGISDTPAWIVCLANQYAKDHGKTPFVIYQGLWNVLDRSFEREIIPMARAQGMALAPWGVLATGKLRSDEEEQKRKETGEGGRSLLLSGPWERNEEEIKMSRALQKVATEVGAKSITSIAIAYVMHKTTNVFPIIGGRKVEHLKGNLEALDVSLSPEQIKYIDSINQFDPGFPHSLFGDGTTTVFMMSTVAHTAKQPLAPPIKS
ncbi:arylalcohol dehydrogenase [Hymenopellis radicata]|nr:arylalcohol dehydrogenase [Hymenopellis radicata]